MGRKAFFIRTLGCPVKCPWCDSAGTWHPDWTPDEKQVMSISELVSEAVEVGPEFVVITGGEPAIWDLCPLVHQLKIEGIPVHLETSGAYAIKGAFDWVTVSPKRWGPPIGSSVMMASEFKFIVESPSDIGYYLDLINTTHPVRKRVPIWLHPEWSHREDPIVLQAIAQAVRDTSCGFRAGWQLHKLYRVDSLDKRTRPLVPLGGDPGKGF